jgi:hypothetical protein
MVRYSASGGQVIRQIREPRPILKGGARYGSNAPQMRPVDVNMISTDGCARDENSNLPQICANFGLRTLAADRGRFVVALYSSATIEDPGIALGDCLMQSEKIGLQLSRGPRLQLEMMEAVFASH